MKRLFILFIVLLLPCGAVFSQKKETYRVRTVVIDPGHGGAKPGARGSHSYEKNITLDVAKKFGKLIHDNYPDVKIIYTRTTDVDISLAERARIANRNKADLFISIHANSHPTSVPTGVETFVMGLSESRANLEVAKKENADILLEADYKNNSDYSDFDPNSPESYVLLTMFQNSYLDKSLNFAQAIQTQYKRNLKTINRGVKQAELFVLYKTTCPSVLTEIGFISNPTEEAFMLSDEGQAKIAISLFNAFMNFKATEEGSNRVANPKIDIPGYKNPADAKQEATQPEPAVAVKPEPEQKEVAEVVVPQPAPQSEPKAEPKVEPKPEPAPEPKVEPKPEPKPEPKVEPKPEPVPEPEPKPVVAEAAPAPAPAKPTPTVELPQRTEPVPAPKAEEPAPAPKTESNPEPKVEPVLEYKAEPTPDTNAQTAPEREALCQPQNTATADAKEYYTVQFLRSPKLHKVGAKELDGISEFRTVRQGKMYAYSTGRFATLQEASAYSAHLHRATRFKDAWSHLYKEAAVKEETVPETTATPKPAPTATPAAKSVEGLTYRIQFCTSKTQFKPGDRELQGIKDIHSAPAGEYFLYTAGDYATQQEAQKRCNSIKRSTTFKDAFVIAIYNGERITLEQAAALGKKK